MHHIKPGTLPLNQSINQSELIKFQYLAKPVVQTSCKHTKQSCQKSCRCKDHNYTTNLILLCKNETEMIGMPCLHSKITVDTTTVFFWRFRLANFFPAAFWLMLKIFSLAARFGGLRVYFKGRLDKLRIISVGFLWINRATGCPVKPQKVRYRTNRAAERPSQTDRHQPQH